MTTLVADSGTTGRCN